MEYSFLIKNFEEKLNCRYDFFSELLYKNQEKSLEWMVGEHYVELFSSSVLPIRILHQIKNICNGYNCNKIIDPAAGSGFHALIFEKVGNFDVEAFDIDPEKEDISWFNVKQKNLRDIDYSKYNDHAIILSWINGGDLSMFCLNNYKGPIVISIGNYQDYPDCKKYLETLRVNFNKVFSFELEMLWKKLERIEIYIKK